MFNCTVSPPPPLPSPSLNCNLPGSWRHLVWSMRGHAWGHPLGTHSIGTYHTRVVMIRVPVCENKEDYDKLVPLHNVIGVSLSELHTSELNNDCLLYIYLWCTYSICLLTKSKKIKFNVTTHCTQTVSNIFTLHATIHMYITVQPVNEIKCFKTDSMSAYIYWQQCCKQTVTPKLQAKHCVHRQQQEARLSQYVNRQLTRPSVG